MKKVKSTIKREEVLNNYYNKRVIILNELRAVNNQLKHYKEIDNA